MFQKRISMRNRKLDSLTERYRIITVRHLLADYWLPTTLLVLTTPTPCTTLVSLLIYNLPFA